MSFKKNVWTEHSKIKMKQYGLSKQKLLSILYKPERKEQGIAPGTTAVMRTNPAKFANAHRVVNKKYPRWQHPKKAPGEIWLMYKEITLRHGASTGLSRMSSGQERKIISAWRYPGVSKPGEEIPIPEDIRQEILNQIKI